MLNQRLRLVALLAAVIMVLAYLALLGTYLTSPVFFDDVEAQFPWLSWYLTHGHPLYTNTSYPELYLMPYGPFPYIMQGMALTIFGPSIFSAKLVGVVASIFALLAAYRAARQYAPRPVSLIVTGFFVAYWIGVSYTTISSRADVWMLLFTLIGFWACSRPGWDGALILGLCLGICLDIKIHGPLYFLPMVGLVVQRKLEWRKLFATGAVAMLISLLPFVLLPNVSLVNFVANLKVSLRMGLSFSPFSIDCAWLLVTVALLPAAIAWSWSNNPGLTRQVLRENGLVLTCLGLAIFPVLAIASKVGSGAPHLVPLATVAILVGLKLWHDGLDFSKVASQAAVCAAGWVALAAICCFGYGFFKIGEAFWSMRPEPTQQAYAVKADIDNILKQDGPDHVLLMGVGDKASRPVTFMECQLIFGGMPIGLAPMSVADWKNAHLAPPSLALLRENIAQRYPGKSIIWLIPKGTIPFSFVVEDEFRSEFRLDYIRFESTPCFDLYIERAAQPRI